VGIWFVPEHLHILSDMAVAIAVTTQLRTSKFVSACRARQISPNWTGYWPCAWFEGSEPCDRPSTLRLMLLSEFLMSSLTSQNWISPDWLARSVLTVAPDLVGCTLVRRLANGRLLRGTIVETEAYGPDDPACHAYRRRTLRNAVMFGPPGFSYVYLIYGVYHCFNVVSDRDGVPSAVLVRALEMVNPEDHDSQLDPRSAAGPGKLCRVMAIDRDLSGTPLHPRSGLWLEPRQPNFQQGLDQAGLALVQTTRIGLTQGADLPWRWYLKDCPAVSKTKTPPTKRRSRPSQKASDPNSQGNLSTE